MGYLHGGASLAMAETVGSLASQMAVDREQFAALGLDINANHVRPAAKGEVVRAIAKPLHVGRQTHVWEVRLESSGKLICIARLTTSIQPRRKN
jgi:1,4-dihydroxy-2-naphthoyl-CoA hydrolase